MKILLAVDGSECSLRAVEEAARTLWPEGSVVKIVSVAELSAPTPVGVSSLTDGSYGELERIFEERATANITQAIARFGEIAGAQTEATAKTLKGDPKVVLLNEAERWGADLIIVGTHGYNALKRLWLGSVSRAVASQATCSVQIVRQREDRKADQQGMRILLATDGSEFSDAAAGQIADRPWPKGSEVRVISIVQLPFTPNYETFSLPECEYSRLEDAGRDQAKSAIDHSVSWLRQGNERREDPLTVTFGTILGHPGESIIEEAKSWGADLVVLGSHGRRGFQRLLLGSVSQAVASHAPCSVEIVRKTTQPTI